MSDNPTSADQNQDDVEKIDDREIERQAKVFVTTKYKKEFRGPALDSYIKGYKRALKWRDKNPSPAVKGLVEQMRDLIEQAEQYAVPFGDIRLRFAKEALSSYEESLK